MTNAKKQSALEGVELVREVARLLIDKKGLDLVALNVSRLIYYSDYFLIASGRTDLHVRSMVRHVEKEMAERGVRLLSVEGQEHNRWVLIDFGELIVHLFIEPLRELYELERLWGDATVIDLQLAAPPPESPAADDDLLADF